jgi:hypothetical protein
MLPRPATIAAPPSTARPPSWNPAVPPPPVTGAPLGTGLGDGLGDGLGLGLGLVLALAEVLAEALSLAELLAVAVALSEPLALGGNKEVEEEGVEGPDVQAESATQASMVVRRPQPAVVSRTRCAVRAMAVYALIEPPRALGNDHFQVADRRNRRRKRKSAAGPLVADRADGERARRKDRRP